MEKIRYEWVFLSLGYRIRASSGHVKFERPDRHPNVESIRLLGFKGENRV